MEKFIKGLEKDILNGKDIGFEDAIKLVNIEDKFVEALCESANNIKQKFCGDEIDLCTIMNAKSGACSEDCKFCAQSSHYKTEIEISDLVKKEEVLKLARENESEGVNRFSLVTASKGVNDIEFEKIIDIYDELEREVKMNLCASLGILDYEKLKKLREKGITMYHHNLETSKDYYSEICTTHNYEDRVKTIENAKKTGLKVCSGCILGLGESREDRVKLAFELRDLEIESIPINILNPIKGTPLEGMKPLSQEEILKTIAVFRFVNKNAFIRLAGGRNLINESGRNCFKAGANATITGNYLTTSGNKIIDDKNMIEELNLSTLNTYRT